MKSTFKEKRTAGRCKIIVEASEDSVIYPYLKIVNLSDRKYQVPPHLLTVNQLKQENERLQEQLLNIK